MHIYVVSHAANIVGSLWFVVFAVVGGGGGVFIVDDVVC